MFCIHIAYLINIDQGHTMWWLIARLSGTQSSTLMSLKLIQSVLFPGNFSPGIMGKKSFLCASSHRAGKLWTHEGQQWCPALVGSLPPVGGGMERETEREAFQPSSKSTQHLCSLKVDEMKQIISLLLLSYFLRGFHHLQMFLGDEYMYIMGYIYILMNYGVKFLYKR